MRTRTFGATALWLGALLLAGCGGAAATAGKTGAAGAAGRPPASTLSAPLSEAARSYNGPYPYEQGAVRIHLKADRRLNLFDASPHTLFLCVYHLRDPNGFTQVLDETDGIAKLLECSRFDPSVTNTRRIVVQPGAEVTEALDRPEGARYVGIVAGYSKMRKEDSVRLYPVPIVEERIGWSVRKTAQPGPLAIDLFLGPESIQGAGGR